MATDLEMRAKEAFVDDNFDLAVDLYTQALDVDPKNADLYADRAQANIKLGGFTEAVADANKAIELDPSMTKAYLRKGTACIKLEEYQTAKAALEAGVLLAPGDSRFTKLIKECDERIAEEKISLSKKVMPNAPPTTMSLSSDTTIEDVNSSHPTHGPPNQTKETPNKPKFRHDYYNTPTEVVLTIFAKGIPAENVTVEFGEQTLSVTIDSLGEEYHFQRRLFAKIVPANCRYQVLSTKVEIRLSKAETITWTSLEYSGKAAPQKINTFLATKPQRPSYPSSKSKVDWDKLEAEVKKEEKDEKLDGDAALNKFFQDIYKDADEDTRRAMSKSFVESNGTVLSTNWREVGLKKVEGSAPDGMEIKKWEY
ncbi:suppressor of G2 allele of SKP1 [Musa troglodytarum]|uniref:Protein SGT1 homolog n=1 Tax=Musa troglodytarum TaxID=320322 RepID=A0A9E7GT71_9LILI|nr:suppressor of G2 allele of SKP1 [Musa troglodytarum]